MLSLVAHAAVVVSCWGRGPGEPSAHGMGTEPLLGVRALATVGADTEALPPEDETYWADPVEIAATDPPAAEEHPPALLEREDLAEPPDAATDDFPLATSAPAVAVRLPVGRNRSDAEPEVAPPRVGQFARASALSTPSGGRTAARSPLGPVVVVERVDPVYPPSLRGAAIAGRVVLHVLVDEEGRVAEVRVTTSSGRVEFDRSAVAALRRWRFRTRGASFWASVPVTFRP